MIRLRSSIFPLCTAIACGCGSSPKQLPPVPLSAPSASSAAQSRIAKWLFSPSSPSTLHTRVRLPNGAWLSAGSNGERWVSDPRDGTANAAASLADEDIIAIVRPDPSTFGFVGARGSIFLSTDPLGAFREIRRNNSKFQRVSAAGSMLFGILDDGSIVRSTDAGRSLQPVPFSGARPFDIAVAEDGRALVLCAPEQLWLSNNSGNSFSRANSPPIGASHLSIDARGNPVVQGLWHTLTFRDAKSTTLESSDRSIESQSMELLADIYPTVSAQGILDGQAAVVNGSFAQAISPTKEGQPWSILRGHFGEKSAPLPIPNSNDCKTVSVGTYGKYIAVACLGSSERRQGTVLPSLRLFWSDDQGLTFVSKSTGLIADDQSLRLLALPSGNLIISGACKPTSSQCQPKEPIRFTLRRSSPGHLTIAAQQASELPKISGRPSHIVASPDGSRLFASATLLSTHALGLLLSDDDGLTFRAVPTEIIGPPISPSITNAALLASSQPSPLSIDSDGTLSTTLTTSVGSIWLSFDRDGHVLSAAAISDTTPIVATVGRRAVTLDDTTGDLFESTDQGRHFEKVARIPPAELSVDGRALVWCGPDGCAFGRNFLRLGWGKADGGLPLESPDPPQSAKLAKPLTPIVCKPTDAPHEILGANADISASQADRGIAIWSTIVVDYQKASVAIAQATGGPKPKVDLIYLIPPAATSDYVIAGRPQSEGASAMRYPIIRAANGRPAASAPMRTVDIAWINYFEAGLRKARIADAGTIDSEDYNNRGEGALLGNASQLSISGDGIFVCPHKQCNDSTSKMFFIDGTGRSQIATLPNFPEKNLAGLNLTHLVGVSRVNGKNMAVLMLDQPKILAMTDGASDPVAINLLPSAAASAGFSANLSWAYSRSGHSVGLAVTVSHPERNAFANFISLDPKIEPVALPTQADLADPPASCSSSIRQNSLRIVAPSTGNPKRPIQIEAFGKAPQRWLVSYSAVIYGKPKEACASVLDARPQGSGATRAIVVLDDLEHSWLIDSLGSEKQGLSWQPMSCRFDPNATVPESIQPRPRQK